MRDVLHWLPLRQRIEFRVAVLVWYSLIGQAPAYLTDLCRPSLSVRSTRHLRSAEQGLRPSCPICSHLHHAEPGLLRGRPFSMEWSPTGSPAGHFLEYSPRNSVSNLKQHYSAALGLGALLSSPT